MVAVPLEKHGQGLYPSHVCSNVHKNCEGEKIPAMKLCKPHANNTHVVTIPIAIIESLGWNEGDMLQVLMKGDGVTINKVG